MGVLALLGLMVIKTLGYSSRQLAVPPVATFPVDPEVHERLASGLRFPTISLSPLDTQAFFALDTFL